MKPRLWAFGAVFLFLGLLCLSPQGSVSQTAPAARGQGPLIMWEPDESMWIPKSQAQVHMIIERLQQQVSALSPKGSLTPELISRVSDLYGQDGIFTGHDGWTLRGNREIRLYFTQLLLCHKVSDFRIEIKFVFAKEFTDTVKKETGTLDDISHSLYFILLNSYVLDGKLIRLPALLSCTHQYPCPCPPVH
jgi:hypothetical protein